MFFDVEVTVRIPPAHGEPFRPCAADGEGEELGDQRADGNTGLAQTEELVETASYLFSLLAIVLPDCDCIAMGARTMVKITPIVHMRTVFTGSVTLSTGCTTARTSGNGESLAS